MLAFNNDYSHGAHPAVLQALVDTNMEPQPGYGTDAHTERAKQLIREACQAPDADVFLLVGGTQANATVIDMLLAPYEGVVAAETGHVACHEAGAIEFGGHKVLTIPGYEGKMHAEDLENYIQVFYENESYEHTVFPGAVYVSLSTEYGTLYSKAELAAIHAVCQKREIRCLWTVLVWPMHWRPMSATLPCPSWRSCATCSTSAAPSAARFAARLWCSAACTLRRIPFRVLSSTARCWPRAA